MYFDASSYNSARDLITGIRAASNVRQYFGTTEREENNRAWLLRDTE